MWEAIQRERYPQRHLVGSWACNYIEDVGIFQCISNPSHLLKKPLFMAQYYVIAKFKIPTDGTMSISQVMDIVLDTPVRTNLASTLVDRFKVVCEVPVFEEFKNSLSEIIHEAEARAREEAIANLNNLDEETKLKIKEGLELLAREHNLQINGLLPTVRLPVPAVTPVLQEGNEVPVGDVPMVGTGTLTTAVSQVPPTTGTVLTADMVAQLQARGQKR
jgi:hypothetical protein